MQIGIYARLSEETDGDGIHRQERDARELAERRGWVVGKVYTDGDHSAYKRKPRPAFEQLLADLRDGVVDGLVVWDCDRLARQPRDLERLLDLFEVRPLVFATCQGEIDLSTSDGRFVARLMVNVANKSSADTSRRITRKHLALAQEGVPVGGYRPFGWQADKRTLHPVEAPLIRQAASDLLSGVSLRSILYQWNDAGIRTSAGNIWRRHPLKNSLTSPRLAGYRVYQKRMAVSASGEPVRGQFEPILDVETWERLVAVLTAPERSTARVGSRRYLLSGTIRCALCGTTMVGNADTARNTANYACKRPEGCGKVAASGPKTDELLTRLLLRYLAEREISHEVEPWAGEADLENAVLRIRELMDQYTKGILSGDVVFPAVASLEATGQRLRASRTEWLRKQVGFVNRPANITEAWPTLALEQQRAIVSSLLTAVVVKPATRRGPVFDPSRIELVWREDERSLPSEQP